MRTLGSVRFIAALAIGTLACGTPSEAGELRLIGAATSFYCYPASDYSSNVSGLACDLVSEMARRVGHSPAIQLYPLVRALAVAAKSTDVLVAPVGRVATREKQFGWQVPIFEDDVVVVTRADSPVDISSVAALRSLSLGVVRGGVGELLCKELGVGNTNAVADDDTNARKLDSGRIDAWVSTWNGIRASQRSTGSLRNTVRRGIVLSRVKAYLASSPDVAPERMDPWRKAMSEMINDGTYGRILKKYAFEPPR